MTCLWQWSKRVLAAAQRLLALSLWAPLVGKGLAWAAAFAALAHVGKGAAESLGKRGVLEVAPLASAVAAGLHAREPAPEASAAPSVTAAPCSQPGGDAGRGKLADGRVVLNLASAAALDTLPGIGRKRAEQIVALRTKLGRFRSLRDLLRIRGIGLRQLRKLEPHLTLDPPKEPDP